jgi:hypothetical protein
MVQTNAGARPAGSGASPTSGDTASAGSQSSDNSRKVDTTADVGDGLGGARMSLGDRGDARGDESADTPREKRAGNRDKVHDAIVRSIIDLHFGGDRERFYTYAGISDDE